VLPVPCNSCLWEDRVRSQWGGFRRAKENALDFCARRRMPEEFDAFQRNQKWPIAHEIGAE